MSQGIFRIIDFNCSIESSTDLINKMDAFLKGDGNDIEKASHGTKITANNQEFPKIKKQGQVPPH